MQSDFSQGKVWKNVINQAIPLMVAQLIQILYNVVDRIYIGHLPVIGSNALTGIGLVFPITTLVAAFTNLFSTGGVPLFSMARGAKEEKKAEVSAAPQGAIPEGTVLGDGHIKYGLARIDTRLLHGQVATAWTKTVGPNRIIVVSDNVAHDDLRKSMIEQAAPPGVKANVVPIDKMIQVAKDPRFGATKAMLLFETPQDALRAIKGGVDIKELNLGSMAHSQGKVVCTKAVSMGSDDVKTFDELLAMGIKIDVRKVPTDSPENFNEILKKAKTELK